MEHNRLNPRRDVVCPNLVQNNPGHDFCPLRNETDLLHSGTKTGSNSYMETKNRMRQNKKENAY